MSSRFDLYGRGGFFAAIETEREVMAAPSHIVVATGTDPALAVDYTAFRTVRQQTGVNFTRLDKKPFAEFADHLQRIRMSGQKMPAVHMSMHMSPEGAEFADRLVTPLELSEVLDDVRSIFLAGCRSTAIGDLLGVVPNIITLLEDIPHAKARAMTELYWLARGRGMEPREAYDLALDRLPDVAEYAYFHGAVTFQDDLPLVPPLAFQREERDMAERMATLEAQVPLMFNSIDRRLSDLEAKLNSIQSETMQREREDQKALIDIQGETLKVVEQMRSQAHEQKNTMQRFLLALAQMSPAMQAAYDAASQKKEGSDD